MLYGSFFVEHKEYFIIISSIYYVVVLEGYAARVFQDSPELLNFCEKQQQ